MVGGLIKEQHVGLRQKQSAQRHAALFTAGEHTDACIPWRQAQGIGGYFQLVLGVGAGAAKDGFHLGLFFGQRIKIGTVLAIGGVDFFEPRFGLEDVPHPGFDAFAHALIGVELRLLRQIANVQTRHRHGFALKLLIHTRHDLEQRGLAGTIGAEHADLGAGKETEGNVFENELLRRNDLAEAVHGKYVLGHCVMCGELRGLNPRLSTHVTMRVVAVLQLPAITATCWRLNRCFAPGRVSPFVPCLPLTGPRLPPGNRPMTQRSQ